LISEKVNPVLPRDDHIDISIMGETTPIENAALLQ